MISVQRKLELLRVVSKFLLDNLAGDCSDIEPPKISRDRELISKIQTFAILRVEMSISVEEAEHVNTVLKELFEQAFE